MVELLILVLVGIAATWFFLAHESGGAIAARASKACAWLVELVTELFANGHRDGQPEQPEEIVIAMPDYNQNMLNCRTIWDEESAAYKLEISGLIRSPERMQTAAAEIKLEDVTSRDVKLPVHSRRKRDQMMLDCRYSLRVSLGKLPSTENRIADWLKIAVVNTDDLMMPRKGDRLLQFTVSIVCPQTGQQLASAYWQVIHEQETSGYIDIYENIEKTRTLAVAMAFVVAAANGELDPRAIEFIKTWAHDNIDMGDISSAAFNKLEKALDKTADFFRGGNTVDHIKMCADIMEVAPLGDRYDVLQLCLGVAAAAEDVSQTTLDLLKSLANALQVDGNRFRAMMQKTLPLSTGEDADLEVLLGISEDMSSEEKRRLLNHEYRKWNARVTSCDPQVQTQADQMLKFIAQARVACTSNA